MLGLKWLPRLAVSLKSSQNGNVRGVASVLRFVFFVNDGFWCARRGNSSSVTRIGCARAAKQAHTQQMKNRESLVFILVGWFFFGHWFAFWVLPRYPNINHLATLNAVFSYKRRFLFDYCSLVFGRCWIIHGGAKR